jgi:putative addiction module component (TIGR02574 family)
VDLIGQSKPPRYHTAGGILLADWRTHLMSKALPLPPPGFDDLPVEEKLDYVQSLWDRIVDHPEELPVPDWHLRVIEDRLAAHKADPGAARPGEEVQAAISEKLKAHRSRQA